MRRSRWIALLVVIAVVLIPVVFVAGIYATHPRNQNRFMAQLSNEAFPRAWSTFMSEHDENFFVKEGDRACSFLSQQPIAGIRQSRSYQLSSLMDRYLAETKEDSDWSMGATDFSPRRVVATSAWNNLCQATLLIHQPYRPW
jgi:hypothetical protein